MQKINMNYEELKEIFSLCKMETLDSIDILTYNVTDYDLEEFKRALTMGMQIVYGRCSDDYEGMNEYDFLNEFFLAKRYFFALLRNLFFCWS